MRICFGQYALLGTCAVLALLTLLAGCGSKGPLYTPKDQKAQTEERR